ncbi:hypothetical protein EJB05_33714 [Eragrostis curvula]|uniref:RING-type E3 ubiquitin transferase n=1 Tax=Eragrostis curvula TaxID=38414 RepID=A0A5J9U1Y9_9POAL|nr:hypothetical protein EJB05_33714 [Eragrostis curvula]
MEVEGPSSRPRRPLEVRDTSSPIARKRTRSAHRSKEEPNSSGNERHRDQEEMADINGEDEEQQQRKSEHESSSNEESEDSDKDAAEDVQDEQVILQVVLQEPLSSLGSESIRDVTVENSGVLNCGVCCHPLKPPIFQIKIYTKMTAVERCHVCHGSTSFHRCYDTEKILNSILVPCPHAAHGCATKPVYYDREDHAHSCAHAPCCCPGEACSFIGSAAALLNHIAAAHGWPCTVETSTGSSFNVDFSDGINIVTPVRETSKHLFVLDVMRAPFGRVVTVFCVHPHPAATAELNLSYSRLNISSRHHQCSEFKLACTDLSSALPSDSKERFHLVLPRTVDGQDEGTIRIEALIGAISPSSARSSTSTFDTKFSVPAVVQPERRRHEQHGSIPESLSGSSESLLIEGVTVENAGVLDCGVCFLPLSPPVFQCDVGHIVCAACRAKLEVAGSCHVCRDPTEFHRCFDVEKILNSILVPCLHAAHGCKTKPVYHDREDHARSCTHAPCHCPGEACGFVGSVTALLDHIAATHGWPCTVETSTVSSFYVYLHDGMNIIVTPVRATAEFLFVLKVSRVPIGRVLRAPPPGRHRGDHAQLPLFEQCRLLALAQSVFGVQVVMHGSLQCAACYRFE